eukprot:3808215-Pleurochrysis_carterae.AAC.1
MHFKGLKGATIMSCVDARRSIYTETLSTAFALLFDNRALSFAMAQGRIPLGADVRVQWFESRAGLSFGFEMTDATGKGKKQKWNVTNKHLHFSRKCEACRTFALIFKHGLAPQLFEREQRNNRQPKQGPNE